MTDMLSKIEKLIENTFYAEHGFVADIRLGKVAHQQFVQETRNFFKDPNLSVTHLQWQGGKVALIFDDTLQPDEIVVGSEEMRKILGII